MSIALVVLAFLVACMRPMPTGQKEYTTGFVALLAVLSIAWVGALAVVLWALLVVEGKL